MNERKITSQEQRCISQCINKYWGDPHMNIQNDDRDREYEQCLLSCKICG
jgi:hypothetical protein